MSRLSSLTHLPDVHGQVDRLGALRARHIARSMVETGLERTRYAPLASWGHFGVEGVGAG